MPVIPLRTPMSLIELWVRSQGSPVTSERWEWPLRFIVRSPRGGYGARLSGAPAGPAAAVDARRTTPAPTTRPSSHRR